MTGAALVADIGGTNARFGWAVGHEVRHVCTLPVAQYPRLADAVLAYVQQVRQALAGKFEPPQAAALAVATPVTGDQVSFTNSPWSFSASALQQELGLPRLVVINDFEAQALSLPYLSAQQMRPISGVPRAEGVLAVVGPGTGLGVGAVVRTRSGWQALPGEGGHATVSAADEFEACIVERVRRMHGHASAERLLSGVGLPSLYRAVAEETGVVARELSAADIVNAGLDGSEAACSRTIDVFCAMLGCFAGNVALTLGARGGVFIGGGIVPRLGARFDASAFRERFVAKGRFRDYLQAIPLAVITDTLAALTGAAAAAAEA
jgi:glucokinase